MTTAASSPTAIPSHNMVGITMDIGGSPILSGSGAYLIHGGMENTRHSLSHTSRSSPATVCSSAHVAARGPGISPRELKSLQKIKLPSVNHCVCVCIRCHAKGRIDTGVLGMFPGGSWECLSCRWAEAGQAFGVDHRNDAEKILGEFFLFFSPSKMVWLSNS